MVNLETYTPTIPLPVLMNLTYETLLKYKWCSVSLQPYTHVFCAKAATKLVGFSQTRGFALQKMGEFGEKYIYDSPPSLHEPFSWTNIEVQVV